MAQRIVRFDGFVAEEALSFEGGIWYTWRTPMDSEATSINYQCVTLAIKRENELLE